MFNQIVNVISNNNNFKFDSRLGFFEKINLFFEFFLMFFRGIFLCGFFKKSNKIFIGKQCKFRFKKRMTIGKNFVLGDYSEISALGSFGVQIGNNVKIRSFCKIICSTSYNNIGYKIIIGNNVGVGEFSYIGGGGGTEIGNDTIIGQYFSTHPENHIFSKNKTLIREQGVIRKGIKIGENCWFGSKVTVLDGVKIGDNCVVAAGSVVNKSFPKNSIIGGVPAKLLKKR